jgi:hypothetical protein
MAFVAMKREFNRQVTSPTGRLAAGALVAFAVVTTIVAWKDLSIYGRGLVGLGCVIAAVSYYQIGWKRMVLEDGVLLVHDRVRRVRRIPYGAIWRLTYVKGTVFSLDTESHGVVWFEARAAGLEDFTTELASRVLRERESVVLSGDLEVEDSQTS